MIDTTYEHIENFVDSILSLIEYNKHFVDRNDLEKSLDRYYWNLEMKTTKIKLPRQHGNSRIIYHLLNKLENVSVIVEKEKHLKDYVRNYNLSKRNISTISDIKQNRYSFNVSDYVIVDDERIFEEVVKELYPVLVCKHIFVVG
ncbi:MAG: hypothetical protein AABY22_18095 [Nanoarchaeota archaeon]